MLFDSINLKEGSQINNATIDSGTSFPSSPSIAELFFRTDNPNEGLYVYDGTVWSLVGQGGTVDLDGLNVKAAARAATTTNITLSGLQTIDGVALFNGDRVLVKNQSTASQNGIYEASSSSWVRTSDFDGSPATEVKAGDFVFVTEGTTQGDTGWVLTTNGTITIGTTALTFSQFTGTNASPGGTTGQLQYNNAGVFAGLSTGTSGQYLISAGPGVPPTWQTIVGVTGAGAANFIQLSNGSGGLTASSFFTTGGTLSAGSAIIFEPTVNASSGLAGYNTTIRGGWAHQTTSGGGGGGSGGNLFLLGGAAQPAGSGSGGDGGDVRIVGGPGGTATGFPGDGGDVIIDGGLAGNDAASNKGGSIVFSTAPRNSGSFARAERLRISELGAFGLGGANYGTLGQVLTSSGSGSTPTWQTPVVKNPGGSTGQLQYNNAGNFAGLGEGDAGQVLTSNGAGVAPSWASPTAGGGGGNAGTIVAQVYRSGAANTHTTGWAKVPYNTVSYDPSNIWNPVSTAFVPTIAGYYQVTARVRTNTASNAALMGVAKNGSLAQALGPDVQGTNINTACGGTAMVYCNGTTDYIEGWLYSLTSRGYTASQFDTFMQIVGPFGV